MPPLAPSLLCMFTNSLIEFILYGEDLARPDKRGRRRLTLAAPRRRAEVVAQARTGNLKLWIVLPPGVSQ